MIHTNRIEKTNPFEAYCLQAFNIICEALNNDLKGSPDLFMKNCHQLSPEEFLIRAIKSHVVSISEIMADELNSKLVTVFHQTDDAVSEAANEICKFYADVVAPIKGSMSIEYLISEYRHSPVHFSKMVSTNLPKSRKISGASNVVY